MKLRILPILIILVFFASFAYADGAVQIEPDPAYEDDQLFCNVLVNGNGFSYTWHKNNQETGISGAYVSPQYTLPGETWKCEVSKFYGGSLGWVRIGEDSITILQSARPNNPPSVQINTPNDGASFTEGATIIFSGTANDPEDGSLTGASLQWSSDINGNFGQGAQLNYENLSAGTHNITLTATDSQGFNGTDSITITILSGAQENETNISVSLTANQTSGTRPLAVNFTCSVENGTAPYNYNFSLIAPDGIPTTETNIYTANETISIEQELNTEGNWTAVCSVTDYENGTASDSVIINVMNDTSNQQPEIDITNPEDDSVFLNNTAIDFSAIAIDAEDGTLTGDNVRWYDNDVNFANGTNVSFIFTNVGTHQITAVATDYQGATAEDTIRISVVEEGQNLEPEVEIIYPLDGAGFNEGDGVRFLAYANDPEEGVLGGYSIEWYSDIDGFINHGIDFIYSGLSSGTHTITVYAFDSEGLNDSDSVTITVEPAQAGNNSIPDATIINPADGAEFINGSSIAFQGTATDNEDGTNLVLQWFSDIDGLIGNTASFIFSNLSVGEHTITFNATDSQGATGTDNVNINVTETGTGINNPPEMSITSPLNGTSFQNGSLILFEGSATDPEDGILTGNSITWFSGIDGQFANGTSVLISSLSIGVHEITAVATDSQGQSDSDTINIIILAQNQTNNAPFANIISPDDGAVFEEGSNIVFTGEGFDPEEGILSGDSLLWTTIFNNSQNLLGEGESVQTAQLSAGNHTIILYASDSQGMVGNDSIMIEIVSEINDTNQTNGNQTNGTPEELNPPVVRLFSPGDRAVMKTENVDFKFNVTDESDVNVCYLYVDGQNVAQNPAQQGLNTITYALPSGEHSWQVSCRDEFGNWGYSGARMITSDTGAFEYYQPPIEEGADEPDYDLSMRIRFDEYAYPGDFVPVSVTLENTGDLDLADLKLAVYVYDLDAYASASLDLDEGEDEPKTLYLDIPAYAEPGAYDIKFKIRNGDITKTAYRELFVLNG